MAAKNFNVTDLCRRSEVEDAPQMYNLFSRCKSKYYFAPLPIIQLADWHGETALPGL